MVLLRHRNESDDRPRMTGTIGTSSGWLTSSYEPSGTPTTRPGVLPRRSFFRPAVRHTPRRAAIIRVLSVVFGDDPPSRGRGEGSAGPAGHDVDPRGEVAQRRCLRGELLERGEVGGPRGGLPRPRAPGGE